MTTPQERIKQDLVDELAWDNRVLATDIEVQVQGRTVTLVGTVGSHLSREAALEHARTTPGVVEVIDRLGVRYPKAEELPVDERIGSNVENLLDWSPDLEVQHMEVSVSGGVVMLKGAVDALWKKQHAEQLIQSLNGVVAVQNELAVVPRQSRSDQALAEDVIQSIKRRPNVDLDAITVRVENGIVTLSGRVPDTATKQAAIDAVRFAGSVRGITDALSIAS